MLLICGVSTPYPECLPKGSSLVAVPADYLTAPLSGRALPAARETSQPHTAEGTAGFLECTSTNVSGEASCRLARGSMPQLLTLASQSGPLPTGSQLSAGHGSSNQPPLLPHPCPAGWRHHPLLPPCPSKDWRHFTGSHAYP